MLNHSFFRHVFFPSAGRSSRRSQVFPLQALWLLCPAHGPPLSLGGPMHRIGEPKVRRPRGRPGDPQGDPQGPWGNGPPLLLKLASLAGFVDSVGSEDEVVLCLSDPFGFGLHALPSDEHQLLGRGLDLAAVVIMMAGSQDWWFQLCISIQQRCAWENIMQQQKSGLNFA